MRRLTPATLTLMMFGVIGALVVAYIGKNLMATTKPEPPVARRNIPVPVHDLLPGTVVTANHIGLAPVETASLKEDMLVSNRVIVGRVVKETIKAATPIRAGQLYEPGVTPALELGKGMRAHAVTIQGSADVVSGFIKPGQNVDVHLTVLDQQSDRRLNGGVTMTLLKGIRVLGINGHTRQGPLSRDSNIVTLELTPAQVNTIQIAQKRGSLSLSYNPISKASQSIVSPADEDRVDFDQILGLEPIVPPEPGKPFISRIYRKTARQDLAFWKDGRLTDGWGANSPLNQPAGTNMLPQDLRDWQYRRSIAPIPKGLPSDSVQPGGQDANAPALPAPSL